jgi:hypothetical protein
MALRVVDQARARRERAQALVALRLGRGDRRETDEEDRGERSADRYPSTLA